MRHQRLQRDSAVVFFATGAALVIGAAYAWCWLCGSDTPRGGATPTGDSDVAAARSPDRSAPIADTLAPRRKPAAPIATPSAPASATQLFAGRVVQRDGAPLPPTQLFVAPPHRSLLGARARAAAAQSCDLPPDGRFRLRLRSDLYRDAALVNIVGGHGDMTLLTALVRIEADATIVVAGPGDEESRSLIGMVIVRGGPARNGDLLLLDRATREPISFQWGQHGDRIPVELRVLKRRFGDVPGPVVLRLDDAAGLHAAAEFASIDALRARLGDGVVLEPCAVVVTLPELAPGIPARDAWVWSADNRRFPKPEPVEDGAVRLRLTPGEYRVRAANPEFGKHAVARFDYSGGDRVDPIAWGYVAPGPESCLLTIRSADDRPVEGAKVHARLVHPRNPGVEPGWFGVSASSGAAGRTHLAGLLPGEYAVRIAHRAFAEQEVRVSVPRFAGTADGVDGATRIVLQAAVTVAWQLTLPAGAAPVDRCRVFLRPRHHDASRHGRCGWTARELGPGSQSRDFVLRGLPPGAYEVVCLAGRYAGRRVLRVDGHDPLVHADVALTEAPTVAGTVLGVDGVPARGVRVELTAADTRAVHGQAITGDDGRFRLPSLAAGLGRETVLIKDASAKLLAREVVRDGREMHIRIAGR